MNVLEMVKNVKAECHPITNIDGIIKRWLNRGQKVVASKGPDGGWFWLRQSGLSVTTSANTSQYSLSPLVDTSKLITFFETSTPQHITHMSEQEFRSREPGPTATGTPYLYRLVGFSPVLNQPSSSSVITFVSSSASDTNVNVNVQGLNGSGIFITEVVNTNGTSGVATTSSFTKVMGLAKDAKSVGTITATSNSGVVTNVVIAPNDRHVNHPLIKFHDIPDSTKTIYYDFTMKMMDLYDDYDSSLIPEQYHDAIELYAKARCYNHLNNTQAATLSYQEFEARIEDMKRDFTIPNSIVTFDSFGTSRELVEARLPSMFPRGY